MKTVVPFPDLAHRGTAQRPAATAAVAAACAALFASSVVPPAARAQAQAQQQQQPPAAASGQSLEELNRRINDQVRRLAELRRSMEQQEAALQEMRRAVAEQLLANRRGGPAGGAAVAGGAAGGSSATAARASESAVATVDTSAAPPPRTVGQPDTSTASRTTPVAPIFEEPGVLTPRGHGVLEPSLSYSYSSNNRVTLLGYTVLPALLVGLIDVREVRRNTVSAALTGRFGLTNRFEVEARIPYLYRTDTTRSRPLFSGTAADNVFGASGHGIGDIELAARYQLTSGGPDKPFMIGSLRFKSRTGIDPFTVVSDCVGRCDDPSAGTGQPLTLPTGSGFYSIQPGVTWLYPSDPAVLFGSFTYLHNFKRDNVMRTVLNGQEALGTIAPGGVIGFNMGLGLALNDKSSFSIGYDHASVGVTKQNGVTVPGSVRTQIGTLLFGYSYRLDNRRSLNFSLGAGLTPDAPNLTLSLRTPVSF